MFKSKSHNSNFSSFKFNQTVIPFPMDNNKFEIFSLPYIKFYTVKIKFNSWFKSKYGIVLVAGPSVSLNGEFFTRRGHILVIGVFGLLYFQFRVRIKTVSALHVVLNFIFYKQGAQLIKGGVYKMKGKIDFILGKKWKKAYNSCRGGSLGSFWVEIWLVIFWYV